MRSLSPALRPRLFSTHVPLSHSIANNALSSGKSTGSPFASSAAIVLAYADSSVVLKGSSVTFASSSAPILNIGFGWLGSL